MNEIERPTDAGEDQAPAADAPQALPAAVKLHVAFNDETGLVRLALSRPVDVLEMDAAGARSMAHALREVANIAERAGREPRHGRANGRHR